MKTPELVCRKAVRGDDIARIARYLHLTDPYIYPAVAPDPEDPFWQRIVGEAFAAKDNLFSMENLWVALWDGVIVGVCCMIPCGVRMRFAEDLSLTDAEAARLALSLEGYFLPLIEESEIFVGYNVTNLCVDAALRRRGVGESLLRSALASCGASEVHLDVIADNACAIRLYERVGFVIEKAYHGFSGTEALLPCYHMKKPGL